MGDPQTVGAILDRLRKLAEHDDRVSLGKVVNTFGNRSYGRRCSP